MVQEYHLQRGITHPVQIGKVSHQPKGDGHSSVAIVKPVRQFFSMMVSFFVGRVALVLGGRNVTE